jgi:hypothetical protein
MGGRAIEVVRVRITEAGRRALEMARRCRPRSSSNSRRTRVHLTNGATTTRRRNLKIYCDTSVLPENIRGADLKSQKESNAVEELQKLGIFDMHGSHLIRYEVMNTKDESKRNQLLAEQAALNPIPYDEKLLGIQTTTTDLYGGFVSYPMISDVQDEAIRAELIERGLELKDAEHITQAVCNKCDVFLTRDENTIINPHREWLHQRFPNLKIMLPSELLAAQKALLECRVFEVFFGGARKASRDYASWSTEMPTKFHVGDRVEDKETHERGRVTFVYSTLELRDEFIAVLFNGHDGAVAGPADSVRKVSTRQS